MTVSMNITAIFCGKLLNLSTYM